MADDEPSSDRAVPPLDLSAYEGPAVVHQINVSDGGVPKRPIPRALVRGDGIVGDRQRDLRHHGAPHQALCLFACELIEALAAEGHPIQAGSTGENLTTRGLPWPLLKPGTRLSVGPVRLEISEPAVPCVQNARFFSDGRFSRIGEKRHPGWSRLYARVLGEGMIEVGSPIRIE